MDLETPMFIQFNNVIDTVPDNNLLNFNIKNKCSLCHKHTKSPMLVCYSKCINNDPLNVDLDSDCLLFCDYVCARLYDLNIAPVYVDVNDYRRKYLNNRLSKNSMIIYKHCMRNSFKELPHMYFKQDEVPTDKVSRRKYMTSIKQEYYSLIR